MVFFKWSTKNTFFLVLFAFFFPFLCQMLSATKSKFCQEDVVKKPIFSKIFFLSGSKVRFSIFFPNHTGKTVYIFALKLSVEMF